MASYPSPHRDPLIDSRLQQVLSQRGKELLGLGLITGALMLALILGSYSPQDPGWMAATDAPVRNAFGRLGAAIASPLVTITGWGSWGLVLAPLAWGIRLVTHVGEANILSRSVFVPVAVAVGSVWLASLVPGEGWEQRFGLGGLFGDTVLAALMTALPLTQTVANLITLVTFAGTLALYLFVLGSSLVEVRRFGVFLLAGLVLSYAGLLALLGLSARGMGSAAARGTQAWAHRREMRAQSRAAMDQETAPRWDHPPEPVWQAPATSRRAPQIHWPEPMAEAPAPRMTASRAAPAQPDWVPDPYADPYAQPVPPVRGAPRIHAPAEPPLQSRAPLRAEPPIRQPAPMQAARAWGQPDKGGLLARVANLGRRSEVEEPHLPSGELIEPTLPPQAMAAPAPSPDRIRSRIAELLKGRQPEKPVLRFDPQHFPAPRPAGHAVEPPLTRAPAPAPVAVPTVAPLTAPYPGATGFSFSHAFGFQPAAPTPAAPTPAAPVPAPPAPRLQAPAPRAYEDDVLDDEDEDLAPPPRPAAQNGSVLNRRVVPTPAKRAPASRQAQAEAQPRLPFETRQPTFELPPLSLLRDPSLERRITPSHEALEENARMLESVLEDYGVRGEILSVRPGPVVTQYELEPAPGLKASRVIGLSDDIARSMSALSARVSTVPGRTVIGIELPNDHRQTVVLREILSSRDFGDSQMRLPLALGKDIAGEAVVANLAKMPHLLIAGTTGSGKSVAINTMILSLLYKLTPQECRLIMIDPKMLELSVYDGIPHLLSPVVTDPKKAVVALKWVVAEMEDRYRKMSKMGVRNIEGYNGRVREALAKGEMFKRTVQTGFDDATGDPVFETEEIAPEVLPFIVVIVDEMADLMMTAGKEIEACIQRLAQMARGSGIHLIMATQRPSVDVITGIIKANFPTRISFQVTSKIDSRTILGEQGAEQLLGSGDMLYMAGGAKITRVHGPFVSDGEVEEIVAHLKSFGPPAYVSGVLDAPAGEGEGDVDAALGLGEAAGDDALYDQAVAIVARDRKCSTSYIQRKLGIGYNKAARLVEQMEQEGVVSTANHVGKREILVPEA